MKTSLRTVEDHGVVYTALMFACPGCASMMGNSGLHMIPVNTTKKSPSWRWDGDRDRPTLEPSILTHYDDKVCHSFLRNGVFEFLADCTHEFAGQHVDIPHLPEWTDD